MVPFKHIELASVLKGFRAYLLRQYKYPFDSMNHMFFVERENYKDRVHEEGNKRLGHHTWRAEEVGSGSIRDSVVYAIEITENNLVRWPQRFSPESTSHYKIKTAEGAQLRRIEQALFDLFRNDKDESTFDILVELIGKRYDVIAYLYFIKNKSKYLPISPSNFDRAFELIGSDFRTSKKCSWENYIAYLTIVEHVRSYLQTQLSDEVRLLGAHSFLWSVSQIDFSVPKAQIPTIQKLELDELMLTQSEDNNALAEQEQNTDLVAQTRRNVFLGKLAEELVVRGEKEHLRSAGRDDLAVKVNSKPAETPSTGYDVDSYDIDGKRKQIEVKAITSKRFFISANELRKSKSLSNYYIYLVKNIESDNPTIHYIQSPNFEDARFFNLIPVTFIVQFS